MRARRDRPCVRRRYRTCLRRRLGDRAYLRCVGTRTHHPTGLVHDRFVTTEAPATHITSPVLAPNANGGSRLGIGSLTVVALGVIVVDQASKLAVSDRACGDVVCPVRNEALFLGVGGSDSVRSLLVGCVGVALFAAWARVVARRSAAARVGLALTCAGIVANLIDRVLYGGVNDFIVAPEGVVFNIADVAIVAGLATCALSTNRSATPERSPT